MWRDWFRWRRLTAAEEAERRLQRNREACERRERERIRDEDERFRRAFEELRRLNKREGKP